MAEKSAQQQLNELKDLVVAYAKQETLDPIKSIGSYIGWALAGALCFGLSIAFFTVALLRMIQTEFPELLNGHGDSSFVPYLIVIVVLAVGAGLVVLKLRKPLDPKDPL